MPSHPQRTLSSWIVPFIVCFALSACAPKTPQGVVRAGMVTDVGGLGDKSFNDMADRGLQRAKTELGAEVTVLESKSAADYQPNLTALAVEDYDEIFAIGFLMSHDLGEVARNYPKRHFAIVDGNVDGPNVVSLNFKEEEGSFLAGALAAMMSRTHTVAFLGGVDVPLLEKFEAGFSAGARQVDPACSVLVKYAGSFEDVPAGKELASVLYDQHADVIYVAAGKTGLGAFEELRARSGVYAIGVDSDQDGVVPGKILTSMIKHVDVAVFRTVQADVSQKPVSGNVVYGLADGGISLSDFTYTRQAIGAQRLARLRALRQAIVDGRIVPPATRGALATFRPVKL